VALYAFDHELARAPQRASNPYLGEVRLTWWAEVLDQIYGGRPVRAHEAAQPLAAAVARRAIPRELLDAAVEARVQALGGDRVAGEIEAAGPLTEAAALALDPAVDRDAAASLGRAWRAGHADLLDAETRREARRAARRISAAAFPAVAHAALRPSETSEVLRRLRLVVAVAGGRV
jgi:phytoene synthase